MFTWQELIDKLQALLTPEQLAMDARVQLLDQSQVPVTGINSDTRPYLTIE